MTRIILAAASALALAGCTIPCEREASCSLSMRMQQAAAAREAGSRINPGDQAMAINAIKPSSEQAAQEVVVKHFTETLKDPESAHYTFRPLVNGMLINYPTRELGWFMCGTVNAKNSYGGYTGPQGFIAYFDPALNDTLNGVVIDGPQFRMATRWCQQIQRVS